jgi:AcrR family transcriptional regulator
VPRSTSLDRSPGRSTPRGVAPAASPARGGRPRDPALDRAILEATRRQLVLKGYSQMTIADIAAEAGVTRPTVYRRWPGKFELVADALEYGLVAQQAAYAKAGGGRSPRRPFERFRQAVQRIDPCYANPDAIVLQGNFMGETDRTPELLDLLTSRAVEPRVSFLEGVLAELAEQGAVRNDLDLRTVTTMCFGSFFGAHLRGERDHRAVADKVARTMWACIAT